MPSLLREGVVLSEHEIHRITLIFSLNDNDNF